MKQDLWDLKDKYAFMECVENGETYMPIYLKSRMDKDLVKIKDIAKLP